MSLTTTVTSLVLVTKNFDFWSTIVVNNFSGYGDAFSVGIDLVAIHDQNSWKNHCLAWLGLNAVKAN